MQDLLTPQNENSCLMPTWPGIFLEVPRGSSGSPPLPIKTATSFDPAILSTSQVTTQCNKETTEMMFSTKHQPIKYGVFDASEPPSIPEDVASQIPAGQKTQYLPSSDESLWLFSRSWELCPDHVNNTKATLIICHGEMEHSGRYHELATQLVKAGVAVFAQDMRGWGLSDGDEMYLNDVEAFVEDVDVFYKEIHKRPEYASVTHRFILGTSIGGIVAAYSVLAHPHKYSALLSLSGAFKPHHDQAMSVPTEILLEAGNAFSPKFPVKQASDPKLLVKDEEALKNWFDDPLCSKEKMKVGSVVEILRCQAELPNLVCEINTPMFMMIGEDDRVVSLEGSEMMLNCKSKKQFDYYMSPPHTQSQMKIYDGGRHNLLAEPGLKDKVISDIKDWILHRVWCESGCDVAQ